MSEPIWQQQLELILRVVVAFALGGVVGLERSWRAKVAGLRTHSLVAGGAALFTVASFSLLAGEGTVRDPTRIAAQIVTGVGFLGAGAIFRAGGTITGLTTAASIWVAAGLGMLAGGGAYVLALSAAVITIAVLRLPVRVILPRRARRSGSGSAGPRATARAGGARRGRRRGGADRHPPRSG